MAIWSRVLALSSLWNVQLINSFSYKSHCNSLRLRSRRYTKRDHLHQRRTTKTVDLIDSYHIHTMSSTSSSPLPSGDIEVKSAVRRSPRKRGSSDNSAATSSTTTNTNNDNNMELLEKWIQHDNHSYHLDFLSPTQAYKIRLALITWYRANRRKLPWRGDAGPYTGSTAGFAATASSSAGGKNKAKNGKKRKQEDEGKDIRNFFAASSSSKKKKGKTTSGGETKSSKEPADEKDEKKTQNESSNEVPPEQPALEVTAYGVWVSEIMLQQTRVEAVIPYYIKWMKSYPTVHDLANATEEEVNSHWAGLGFYRRARYLHTGAKRVVNEYNGIVPNTVEELLKVEGIGRYTASAVASIAHGVEVPVVDGNVCRVLSRLTGIANHIKAPVMKDDLGWTLAERIINAKSPNGDKAKNKSFDVIGSPGEVNQAMMELGATYCAPSGSGIDDNDPLKGYYVSTQLGVAIGQATRDSSSSVRGHIESLIARTSSAETTKGNQCRLCDPDGISTAFYDITDKITTDMSTDSKTKPKTIYAVGGHACLPIAPPKKSKREEVIAVAVINTQSTNGERCWLMVKRPKEGLLAGQWEFPSVCVWNSAKDAGKPKEKEKGKKAAAVEVPVIDPAVRSLALDSFLSDMTHVSVKKRKQVTDAPIVHIFSHVCHMYYVEHGEYRSSGKESIQSRRWKLDNGKEVGWMTEDDMASVGITSGVRKILAKTQQQKKSK